MKSTNNSTSIIITSPIDELNSSLGAIDNVAKQMQSLSGRLSSLCSELTNFNKLHSSIQSHITKSKAIINQLEQELNTNNNNNNNLRFVDLIKQHSIDINQPVDNSWKFKRTNGRGYGSGFFRDLKHIAKEDINYNILPFDIMCLLFTFLEKAGTYGGYAYGGIIRDFIVPFLWFHADIDNLDFKDVDIWFKTTKSATDFVNSLNGPIRLIPANKMDDIRKGTNRNTLKTQPLYDCFTREQYIVQFNDLKLFIVDMIVADKLPVNDFSVNLLILKPKGSDFGSMSYSWFEVGQDTYDEYINYSVKGLIDSIGTHETDVLSKYLNPDDPKYSCVTDFKSIVKQRIERMIDWEWILKNYKHKSNVKTLSKNK